MMTEADPPTISSPVPPPIVVGITHVVCHGWLVPIRELEPGYVPRHPAGQVDVEPKELP